MKKDLPHLMTQHNLDALVILGPDGLGAANTAFTYFTGGTHVTQGTVVVKRVGQGDSASIESYLVHSPMERDEAAKTGLQLVSAAHYRMQDIVRQTGGDRLAARVEWTRRLFADLGVKGRVGFYGADSVGSTFAYLDALIREEVVEVVAEYEKDVISQARETKDAQEVALIREACRLTEGVIGQTRDYLRTHAVKDGVLIRTDGSPLTIGDVKAFIRREEAAAGLDDPGCIFSIGRDAGVPHSSGTLSDSIRLGQTIVFDIFPRLAGSYYADITRTWCLGHATDEVVQAYETVMKVHDTLEQVFDTQRMSYEYQDMTCDIFEAAGHRTIRQDLSVTNGYVHGLGHGFGLDVHEPPSMSLRGVRPDEPLKAGTIVTNEPGLYYPDKGFGIRVEDDYWCNPQGRFECLTTFDRSLVIPM